MLQFAWKLRNTLISQSEKVWLVGPTGNPRKGLSTPIKTESGANHTTVLFFLYQCDYA